MELSIVLKTNSPYWASAFAGAVLTANSEFKDENPSFSFSIESEEPTCSYIAASFPSAEHIKNPSYIYFPEETEDPLKLSELNHRRSTIEIQELYGMHPDPTPPSVNPSICQSAVTLLLRDYSIIAEHKWFFPEPSNKQISSVLGPDHWEYHGVSDLETREALMSFLRGYGVVDPKVYSSEDGLPLAVASFARGIKAVGSQPDSVLILAQRARFTGLDGLRTYKYPACIARFDPEVNPPKNPDLFWPGLVAMLSSERPGEAFDRGVNWRIRESFDHDHHKMIKATAIE